MSRSYKEPYIKDRPRNEKKSTRYWRAVRRVIKNFMNSQAEELPDPKTIINDYDYSDYRFVSEDDRYKRK